MPIPFPSSPKLVHLDTIGAVICMADFQSQIEQAGSSPRPLFKVRKKAGAQWTVAFVEGLGLAVVSHQTLRVFVIHCRTFVDLAAEAGIEQQAGLIVIPAGPRPTPRLARKSS